MPFLLRIIRLGRWYTERPPWLPAGEAPADPLKDLCTDSNVLSVWSVDDQQSNLERVAAAFATTRDEVANVDYVLIPEERVSDLGINIVAQPGDTADEDANSTWHRDLAELTCTQVAKLGNEAWTHGVRGRVLAKKIGALIKDGLEARQLKPEKFNAKLTPKLKL